LRQARQTALIEHLWLNHLSSFNFTLVVKILPERKAIGRYK